MERSHLHGSGSGLYSKPILPLEVHPRVSASHIDQDVHAFAPDPCLSQKLQKLHSVSSHPTLVVDANQAAQNTALGRTRPSGVPQGWPEYGGDMSSIHTSYSPPIFSRGSMVNELQNVPSSMHSTADDDDSNLYLRDTLPEARQRASQACEICRNRKTKVAIVYSHHSASF